MTKRITTLLSAEEVTSILANRMIEQRQVQLVPNSPIQAELMAIFTKDDSGNHGVSQYRIEVTVEELPLFG